MFAGVRVRGKCRPGCAERPGFWTFSPVSGPGAAGRVFPHQCLKLHKSTEDIRYFAVPGHSQGLHMDSRCRCMKKGESRLFRVQFDGSSRAEAVEQCSSAVLRLQEYLPVGSQPSSAAPIQLSTAPKQDAPLAASPPQHLLPVPGASARPDPELAQGTLSLRCLAQHFLGEGDLSLPMAYHHLALPHGDLEPFLRLCLFDPSFPAFVEEVEGELKKLANE
ncbi:meiotic recombination protein REC114-like isoform X2 [Denticeps clupeoides]|uniref:meiotic recombination protein REC114-like isoform X2 n=1 Tax=Denticeps clupeoides TaxID=299321 RepID=UPI0010A4A022|nr:meiotic recombination protein REC114-like isoform X2 [Denticeps clupeoides]